MADAQQKVTWEDLAGAAESMFDIWLAGSEVEWAKAAWGVLERKGLSAYSGDIERTRVLVRFLALAVMYREFCHASGLEEGNEPLYGDWAETLEISPLRLGQLVGSEFEVSETSEYDLREHALSNLVNHVRGEVFNALVEGFGSISYLFASLWVTPRAGIDPADLDDETLNEALNDELTGEKLEGFAWVEQGMPSVSW